MKIQKQKLLIEQIDKKLAELKPMENITVPRKGWVSAIRIALKMSLRQMGNRLSISSQSAKEIEEREVSGAITLRALREVANALEMKLVYGFVPKEDSIETLIQKRAQAIAREIVLRTSNTMKLEGQENSDPRIEKAITDKTEEIKNKMPKYLWD